MIVLVAPLFNPVPRTQRLQAIGARCFNYFIHITLCTWINDNNQLSALSLTQQSPSFFLLITEVLVGRFAQEPLLEKEREGMKKEDDGEDFVRNGWDFEVHLPIDGFNSPWHWLREVSLLLVRITARWKCRCDHLKHICSCLPLLFLHRFGGCLKVLLVRWGNKYLLPRVISRVNKTVNRTKDLHFVPELHLSCEWPLSSSLFLSPSHTPWNFNDSHRVKVWKVVWMKRKEFTIVYNLFYSLWRTTMNEVGDGRRRWRRNRDAPC